MKKINKYWFRPKRFWKWFAAYYPASWQGWLVVYLAMAGLGHALRLAEESSPLALDRLFYFAPYFFGILIAFDLLTRLTGEYPAWWKKQRRKGRRTKAS